MTSNHAHTPTVLDEMRTAFAMRHWNLTGDQKEGERLFDEEIARIEAAAEQRGAERGWDEGQKSGLRYAERALAAQKIGRPDLPGPPTTNPYRADLLEGDDE